MPHLRLGVVLFVPPPLAHAVDGLRRAFGDPMLERVAPHITLVPPVNVRSDAVGSALAVIRSAAASVRPVDLVLGPVTAFPGDEHVVYLAVGGEDGSRSSLTRLRDQVFRAPLERRLDHDFVPHVTLTTGVDEARLDAVLAAAADWTGEPARFGRVHLLAERRPQGNVRWIPIADVALGPRIIVGRGGLELELTPSQVLDPEADAARARWSGRAEVEPAQVGRAEVELADLDGPGGPHPSGRGWPLVVVARREGQVVGVASGRIVDSGSEEPAIQVAPEVVDDGVDGHLRAAWLSAAAAAGG